MPLSAIILGLGIGSMYALLGLAFHMTFAVSRTVNFALGVTMMLGAVLCFTFWVSFGLPLAVAVALAVFGCVLWTVFVEWAAIRPFVARGSEAWLMATVALGLVLENVVLFLFGKDARGMPGGVLTATTVSVGGVTIQALLFVIPAVALLIVTALWLFTKVSRYGKAALAVVQNKDAARLMGISVERVVTASFALSGAIAGIAGILVAPLFVVSSTMGTLFGIKAFAVAILGGINNAGGVLCAGLLYGLLEAFLVTAFGSANSQIATFALVLAVLALAPNGLFGRAQLRKV
jgi:branched-chain amino acid transport system permease protein